MEYGLTSFFQHIVSSAQHFLSTTSQGDLIWLCVGLLGQVLFMMRFIVQWLHSERHQKSVIPVSFWYFSLIGGLTVLLYGLHKSEPVIILGQLPGTFVYARNLILIRRHEKSQAELEKDVA
ncbi:MAG: lipid-A-disaccharide synthase N-terminal domain-containing protein [Candidatus Methylopumilus sp.]